METIETIFETGFWEPSSSESSGVVWLKGFLSSHHSSIKEGPPPPAAGQDSCSWKQNLCALCKTAVQPTHMQIHPPTASANIEVKTKQAVLNSLFRQKYTQIPFYFCSGLSRLTGKTQTFTRTWERHSWQNDREQNRPNRKVAEPQLTVKSKSCEHKGQVNAEHTSFLIHAFKSTWSVSCDRTIALLSTPGLPKQIRGQLRRMEEQPFSFIPTRGVTGGYFRLDTFPNPDKYLHSHGCGKQLTAIFFKHTCPHSNRDYAIRVWGRDVFDCRPSSSDRLEPEQSSRWLNIPA